MESARANLSGQSRKASANIRVTLLNMNCFREISMEAVSVVRVNHSLAGCPAERGSWWLAWSRLTDLAQAQSFNFPFEGQAQTLCGPHRPTASAVAGAQISVRRSSLPVADSRAPVPPLCGSACQNGNAIRYAKFYSRSHGAVIHVYDEASTLIETHEQAGSSKSGERYRAGNKKPLCGEA
jgi:hypothetical protein